MLNKLMLSTSIALMSTAALATAQAQEAEMHTQVATGAEAEMADIHRRAAQGGDLSGGGGEVDPWDDRGEGGGSDPVNGA